MGEYLPILALILGFFHTFTESWKLKLSRRNGLLLLTQFILVLLSLSLSICLLDELLSRE
jgi:hypothetical protein